MLSSREKEDELADIAAENERQKQEDEARRLAAEQVARLIQESKTQTKVILNLKFRTFDWFGKNPSEHSIAVTDVNFEFPDMYSKKPMSVWYGYVENFDALSEGIMIINLRVRLKEYGYAASLYALVGSNEQRQMVLTELRNALRAWRTRFPNLPASD